MGYIRVPVETNPTTLANEIFAFIQANQPGWTPADGNLDVWIVKAMAFKAAESRTLASNVPDDIFGSLGSSLYAIPPIDSVAATGDTTWTLSDTAGHTIPAGTFVGVRNANGDLVTFVTLADVIVAPGSSVTAAGEVAIRATDSGTVGNGFSGVVELVDTFDWVTSIALVSSTGGGIDPETNPVYLDRLSRKLQSLSTVPILNADFANAAKDADPGVFRAVAIDLYNPFHNFLTVNEADAETDASGWINLTNATIGSTAAQHANGAKSVSLTSVAAGDMNAILNREQAVTAGQTYTARASARSAVSARSVKVGIRWVDVAHANIGSIIYGTPANDSTGGWTDYFVTAVAPANAVYAKVVLFVTGTGGASEVHYFDTMSIRHGSSTDWVVGGTAETGNARTVTVAAVNTAGAGVSSGIKTAIANYIAARREQNWIVHVMDPNYTSIDVATTYKILPGYDLTSTDDAVEAALANYLSSANWGLDPTAGGTDALTTWVDQNTVYYNELIALVSSVAGVDRVTDLTVNVTGNTPARVDVPITQPAGLTTVGTVEATGS